MTDIYSVKHGYSKYTCNELLYRDVKIYQIKLVTSLINRNCSFLALCQIMFYWNKYWDCNTSKIIFLNLFQVFLMTLNKILWFLLTGSQQAGCIQDLPGGRVSSLECSGLPEKAALFTKAAVWHCSEIHPCGAIYSGQWWIF